MSYTSFSNISEVCVRFNLSYKEIEFVKEKNMDFNPVLLDFILSNFRKAGTFINETVICERVISPLLSIIADENDIALWSHVLLNVDKEQDLVGEADYLLAKALPGNQDFTTPVLCLVEAKRDDFIQGWAQASSEMVAAQIKNNSDVPIYGIVSTGKQWEFGVLKAK